MKRYKVLKEYVHPKTGVLIKPGYEFNYESEYTNVYMKALEREKFVEVILEQPKTVWDLREGDDGWFIDGDGIKKYVGMDEIELILFKERVAVGDAFLTKEDAEKELARRKAKVILERDTKGFKPDWRKKNREREKWFVVWDIDEQDIIADYTNTYRHNRIYFATQEDAEASIKAHPNEWKTHLGVEE